MSTKLMKYITDEIESVTWSSYPSYYNGLGYNSSDIFILCMEQGIYKWMKENVNTWKNVSCPTIGIVTTSPPAPLTSTLKTSITIAPLAGMDLEIPSPWGTTVVPGPLRLSTFIHQALYPDYPSQVSPLNFNLVECAKAVFEAVCMWMNAVWLINISDPSNPTITNATGTGVILFPGVKLMGDLFARIIKLYKPNNYYSYVAIFAFFLWLGVQGNISLPIPTIGTAPAGPYVGLTCPIPFLLTDTPSLPALPSLPGPNISLPAFSIPSLPTITIPEYPGLPGLPDISFAVPEINLDFVLPILGLASWSDLVIHIAGIKGFPFTLGGFEFWTLKDFNFQLTFPSFGPFSLDLILEGFGLTLPEFCNLTNLFSLPSFTLPEMTLLAWAPTVLLCTNGLNEAMSILNENSNSFHQEAFTSGTMSGISISGSYFPVTSGSFESSINSVRDAAFDNADDYASVVSRTALDEPDGYSVNMRFKVLKPKVFAYKYNNEVPFVRGY